MVELFKEPTQELNELLRATANSNMNVAMDAQYKLAKLIGEAVTLAVTPSTNLRPNNLAKAEVIRKGVIAGDILDFYQSISIADGESYEFPTDLLAPGTEKDFIAYTIPRHGKLPERTAESDFVKIGTFSIGNSFDWLLKYPARARWDVMERIMQVYEGGYVKKKNDCGFQTLLYAIYDRNIIIYDEDAAAGQFTKRVVSLGKMAMRRNGGGNSTSMDRSKLTDIIMSPEGTEDMRNWNVDQVDEVTRREIFLKEDGTLSRIFGVNIQDLDELGVGQEYQLFFTSVLGGTLGSSDVEFAIGLDKTRPMAFVSPVIENGQIETFPRTDLHMAQRAGVYGWIKGIGYGVMDGRAVLGLSF